MNTIKEFKEANEFITDYRKMIKEQMESMANNIYTGIIQTNYTIKTIIDLKNFMDEFSNPTTSVTRDIRQIVNDGDFETKYSISNNIMFNLEYVKSIMETIYFAKMLPTVLQYWITKENQKTTLKDVYLEFVNENNIRNQWNYYSGLIRDISNKYKNLFDINITYDVNNEGDPDTLDGRYSIYLEIQEYKKYVDALNYLINEGEVNRVDQSVIGTHIFPNVDIVASFEGSTIYRKFLRSIESFIDSIYMLLNRLDSYKEDLIRNGSEFHSSFKESNEYINSMSDIIISMRDLLRSIKLKYTTTNSMIDLINDQEFQVILNSINNLYIKELSSFEKLISFIDKDYKLLKSLNTFIYEDQALSNSTLFSIMSDYDSQIEKVLEDDNFSVSSKIVEFKGFNTLDEKPFSETSFNHTLFELGAMTEPMYDILNYYRIVLFSLNPKNSVHLIFDFLLTLHIYNISITKQDFNEQMEKLFNIKIDNVDYIRTNEGTINETISSMSDNIDNLNLFDIDPYVNKIFEIDIHSEEFEDMDYETFGEIIYDNKLPHMIFAIADILLYDKIEISLILEQLSEGRNIKNEFYKIMIGFVSYRILNLIRQNVGEHIPEDMNKYYELLNNEINLKEELSYLVTLMDTKNYYEGKTELFNYENIVNMDSDIESSIWDPKLQKGIIKLFSVFKEV